MVIIQDNYYFETKCLFSGPNTTVKTILQKAALQKTGVTLSCACSCALPGSAAGRGRRGTGCRRGNERCSQERATAGGSRLYRHRTAIPAWSGAAKPSLAPLFHPHPLVPSRLPAEGSAGAGSSQGAGWAAVPAGQLSACSSWMVWGLFFFLAQHIDILTVVSGTVRRADTMACGFRMCSESVNPRPDALNFPSQNRDSLWGTAHSC